MQVDAIQPLSHKPNQGINWLWVIILSIAIHALLLIMLNGKVKFPKETIQSPEKSIVARLVFPPSRPVVEPVDKPLPEIKEITQPPKPSISKENTEKVDIVEPIETTSENQAPAQEQTNLPAASPEVRPSIQERTGQYLRNLSIQNDQQMLTQGAGSYRQQHLQERVRPSRNRPVENEELAFRRKVEVKVNCDKGINSTLSMLSGIMGGSLKCSNKGDDNPAASFIDKRLEKYKKEKPSRYTN